MIWHALTVVPNTERSVRNRLHADGYAAVTPVEMVERVGAGKRKCLVPRPLLPGYCLIGSDRFDWPAIRATRDVRGLMMIADSPAVIPALAVENLICTMHRLESERLAPPRERPAFRPGERIRIMSGPYAGYTTEFGEMKKLKARVILEILGSAREVEIAMADLEAA